MGSEQSYHLLGGFWHKARGTYEQGSFRTRWQLCLLTSASAPDRPVSTMCTVYLSVQAGFAPQLKGGQEACCTLACMQEACHMQAWLRRGWLCRAEAMRAARPQALQLPPWLGQGLPDSGRQHAPGEAQPAAAHRLAMLPVSDHSCVIMLLAPAVLLYCCPPKCRRLGSHGLLLRLRSCGRPARPSSAGQAC